MKARSLFLTLLLSVAVSPLRAQSDALATREDVEKLFHVMNIRDQMRLTTDSVAKQQSKFVHESLQKRYPEMTDEQLNRLDSAMKEGLRDTPVEGMIDDMIPIYQKHPTSPTSRRWAPFTELRGFRIQASVLVGGRCRFCLLFVRLWPTPRRAPSFWDSAGAELELSS